MAEMLEKCCDQRHNRGNALLGSTSHSKHDLRGLAGQPLPIAILQNFDVTYASTPPFLRTVG